ncbi:MAG: hypothetical protein ABIF71_04905 [Planctomycetota bacterium]
MRSDRQRTTTAVMMILLAGVMAVGTAHAELALFDPETAPHYAMTFQGREGVFYQSDGADHLLVNLADFGGIDPGYFRRSPLICFPVKVRMVTDGMLQVHGSELKIYCRAGAVTESAALNKGDNIWVFAKMDFRKGDAFDVVALRLYRLPTDRDVFARWKSAIAPGDQKALIDLGFKAVRYGREHGNLEVWAGFGRETILEAVRIEGGILRTAEDYLGIARTVMQEFKDPACAAAIVITAWQQFPEDPAPPAYLTGTLGYALYNGTWLVAAERYEREYADRLNAMAPNDAAGMWALKAWVEANRVFLQTPEEKIVLCAQQTLHIDPNHAEARRFLHAGEQAVAAAPARDAAAGDAPVSTAGERYDRFGVSQSYAGKYVGYTEYRKILSGMAALRKQVVERINTSLGFDYDDHYTILVRFQDDNGEWERPGHTEIRKVEWRQVPVVTIFVEHIITGTDLETLLAHEFIHGVMLERMADAYEPLPTWLKEGITMWGSGELEDDVARMVAGLALAGEQPLGIVNGLERLPHTALDYAEDGLFFEYLAQTYGQKKVQAMIRELVNGGFFKQVVEKETGDLWDRIKEDAARFSRDYIKDKFAESITAYGQADDTLEKAREVHRNKEYIAYRAALAGFDAVRKQYPGTYIQIS